MFSEDFPLLAMPQFTFTSPEPKPEPSSIGSHLEKAPVQNLPLVVVEGYRRTCSSQEAYLKVTDDFLTGKTSFSF